MAGNSLTPLLSREQYRSLYLDNLQSESAINAFNLNANIEWAASGDTEQEAALAATLQSMSKAQVSSEADAYVRALVIARDVQFVLGRLTLDQKKFIILNYAKIAGQMARLNVARPAAGPIFLEILYSLYVPIKTDNSADILASQAANVAEQALQVGAAIDGNPTSVEIPVLDINPSALPSGARQTRADVLMTGVPSTPPNTLVSASTVPSSIAMSRVGTMSALTSAAPSRASSPESSRPATPASRSFASMGPGLSPQMQDNIARRRQQQMTLTPGDRSFDSRSSASTVPERRRLPVFQELTDPDALSAQRIAEDAAERVLNDDELDEAHSDMLNAIHTTVGPIDDAESLRSHVSRTLSMLERGEAPELIYEVGREHGGSRAASTVSGVANTLYPTNAYVIESAYNTPLSSRSTATSGSRQYRLPREGRGVGGKRKSTTNRRMYLAGAGVATPGPKAADHGWQKFGKYILARNDLENGDRVHIRYCNGQPIRRIPVKIAGSGVKAVLSSIADKKRPSASDMKKLSEDEKDYVQSLIKTASIAPTEISTTKSDKEQMKHEFEKMKGQIVAGNDSPELIKKFKQTIKAMQQSKLLPASSVSEILHELSTLGH